MSRARSSSTARTALSGSSECLEVPERPVFQGFGGDRFRTAITRACTAAAVPQFSPHDLRHRRVSLLHLGGMPWARIGELVGHDDLMTTARTYTHVLADEGELHYADILR
jgi:integrase